MNREREAEFDWPAGQKWREMVGSSHAIFARIAREKAGIDDKVYLDILRHNDDALDIAEIIGEHLYENGFDKGCIKLKEENNEKL